MINRQLVACSFLATTCLTSFPLMAQTFPVTPPARYMRDQNGVDVARGTWTARHTDISIGEGAAKLALTRDTEGMHNYLYYLKVIPGSAAASTGFNLENFSSSGSIFTSTLGDGATLIATGNSTTPYQMTLSDGTVINYGSAVMSIWGGATDSYWATSIVEPDGNTVNLTYDTGFGCTLYDSNRLCVSGHQVKLYRLGSVSNQYGYMLQYEYVTNDALGEAQQNYYDWQTMNKVVAVNRAKQYCDQSVPSRCVASATTPSVSYPVNVDAPIGTITKVVGGVGGTWTFSRDGTTTSVYDSSSANPIMAATYTGAGVTSITNGGQTWSYNYSTSGNTATLIVTDPLGHTKTYVSDLTVGLPTSIKDGLGYITSYTYDTSGRLVTTTYPDGNSVTNVYDGRGNVKQVTYTPKSGSGLAVINTYATFATTCSSALTCNQPSDTTDARGNVTTYTYDPTSGNVATVTLPAVNGVHPQTRYTYSALQAYVKNSSGAIVATGSPVYLPTAISRCMTTAACSGAADEVKTTITYGTTGVANNLSATAVTTASGNPGLSATTAYAYDDAGHLFSVDGPLSGTVDLTRYRYDKNGLLLGVVGADPDGAGTLKSRAVRYTYDADWRPTLVEQGTTLSQSDADWANFAALQQQSITYDSIGRKTQDTAQAGGTTYAVVQYSYDAAGRLQCTAQRMNPAVFTSLPSTACTQGTAGSYGADRITYNGYDNADRLTSVTDGYGTSAARVVTGFAYSQNGKTIGLSDAKGNLTSYVYDGFDRLFQTKFPLPTGSGSSTTDFEQLGYDAAGNVISRRLRDGTSIGYGYDALNRLSNKTLPAGEHGVTYAYDNLGHPTTIAGATSLTYGWDALGRMTSETQAYGSVAYQYDLANRRTRLTWQDGTYLTYDYDNVDEMSDIKENGGTVLASFTYDDLGERKTRVLANGTSTTYGYDPASRLTSLALSGGTNANTATLSNYSPAGELGAHANSNDAFAWTAAVNLNRAYTINGLNQFATVAGATQGYDSRGNLTSSGGTTYAYSSENLLKTVSGGFTLAYDPIGRLNEYDVPTATRFVYDGGMISEEVSASGALLRRYVFGPSGDEPIVWYEGSGTGTKRYMDQDERGSVTRITDSTGATVAVDSYDDFGIPGPSNQGRFGYTGQAWLTEAGLAYYKARIYSPTLGRFLQTDPIGYADGPNWYNYVHSDPVNGIDWNGLGGVVGPDIPVTGVKCHGDFCSNTLPPGSIISSTPTGGAIGVPWVVNAKKKTPQNKVDPCSVVAAQTGKIAYTGLATSFIFGGGITRTSGHFTNLRTGSTGNFVSYGVGLGLSLGAGVTSGTYDSISDFTGYSETAEAGITIIGAISVGGSITTNANNRVTATSGGWAFNAPLPIPAPEPISRIGVSSTASDTSISGCTVGPRQ